MRDALFFVFPVFSLDFSSGIGGDFDEAAAAAVAAVAALGRDADETNGFCAAESSSVAPGSGWEVGLGLTEGVSEAIVLLMLAAGVDVADVVAEVVADGVTDVIADFFGDVFMVTGSRIVT